jgi:hypothetical protein
MSLNLLRNESTIVKLSVFDRSADRVDDRYIEEQLSVIESTVGRLLLLILITL